MCASFLLLRNTSLNLLTSIKFDENPNTWKKMKRIIGWEILYNFLTHSCALRSIRLVPSSGPGTQQNLGESRLYGRPNVYSPERSSACTGENFWRNFLLLHDIQLPIPYQIKHIGHMITKQKEGIWTWAKNEIREVVKNFTPTKVETPSDWTHIGPSFTPIKQEICQIKHRAKVKKDKQCEVFRPGNQIDCIAIWTWSLL